MFKSAPSKRLFFLSILTATLAGPVGVASEVDRALIRQAVDTYVDAYNRRDLEAVAAHWSEAGIWITPDGKRIQGRELIREELNSYFESDPAAHIEVNDPKIRFLASTVAVEEGRARVIRPKEAVSETSYIAIHVKENGLWKLESVRETAVPAARSSNSALQELEWMIGTWVDKDESGEVTTTVQWTKNRNFMTRSFVVNLAGQIKLEGTQIVGYDPVAGRIRSWLFDSDGGFGEAEWTRDGERWIIKSRQTRSNGRQTSAINIVTKLDDDRFLWESSGREIDGEPQPHLGPVTVVRK